MNEPSDIYGFCYGCSREQPVDTTGPNAGLIRAHPGRDGGLCPGTGRRPGYFCSAPDRADIKSEVPKL
jgi:hypothetical protein